MHFLEHVIGSSESPDFGVADFDVGREADEPKAVAVTEQTPGPHLGDGGILLCNFVGRFNFLERNKEMVCVCLYLHHTKLRVKN